MNETVSKPCIKLFLKWRKCKLEEEEVFDMFLLEETKTFHKMRDKQIMIYQKKCQKMYNNYCRACLNTEIKF